MQSPSKFMIADRGLTEQQMREKRAKDTLIRALGFADQIMTRIKYEGHVSDEGMRMTLDRAISDAREALRAANLEKVK